MSGVELSRRDFLIASGALVVSFSLAAHAQGSATAGELDSWIAIAADGGVLAFTGKVELGQGIHTAQAQLIAEELVVPLARVTLLQGDTERTPDQGNTAGSQSHPVNFNRAHLALAAATAREALVKLAAERLGVSAARLTVKDGVVSVGGDASRSVGYGALVGGRKLGVPLDPDARRRHPREWTVLGKSVPRLELPAMVTGTLEYVHHVRVPGMLHGQVVRPPAVGATVAAVDEASVRDLPGVVKVVVRKDFVGVVATRPWAASVAANRLKVTWSKGSGLPDAAGFLEAMRRQPARDTLLVDSEDVDRTLARAATVVAATYLHPYQMHGSLATSCAVADVQGDKATIWSSSQNVHALKVTSAMVLGLRAAAVRVIYRMGSGCYGLNGADTVSYDAAVLSQATGKPVRVQLTRHDEMAWENYGLPFVVDQRAGLDARGRIVAWACESWAPMFGGRPRTEHPGNVITGTLLGFEPQPFAPRAAAAPESFANNGNDVPSYLAGRVGAQAAGTGTVASERVLAHAVRSPLYTGPLRSPRRLQNSFAHESFMDELAARAGADPLAFRLAHLRDPRLRKVLASAAERAGWKARRARRRDAGKGKIASGRGIACVLYEGDNGYCAMVADVDVDRDAGAIQVARLVVAVDCGPVSNPDGLRNQIEGGALQGMSRALVEEVTWDRERVTSTDWKSYRTLTLGHRAPVVDTVIVDQPDAPACGAGETSITLVAAAIGNAVFDATGARLRQVPFTPERVVAALRGRAS